MDKYKEEQKNKSASRPNLKIDWPLYEKYLADSDLSDEQKKEFIETLWSIMIQFVDLGFGIAPVQQVLEDKSHPDSGSVESPSATIKGEPAYEGIK